MKKTWTYILEKGIAVEELGETPIPATVEARGWAGYVRLPCNANISVVREFYANMLDSQYSSHVVVVVRGVPMVISVETIREYFGLLPHEPVEGGYLGKYELGCALRREGGAGWNGQKLLRRDLHLDTTF